MTQALSHLHYVCKVFSFNAVVSLDEDLSQDRFSNRVVFCVELVKAMERITILISIKKQYLFLHYYLK